MRAFPLLLAALLVVSNSAAAGPKQFQGANSSNSVSSFNGRSGAVSPAANDYNFNQLAGAAACAQLPALTGDAASSAGSCATTVSVTHLSAALPVLQGGTGATTATGTGSVVLATSPSLTTPNLGTPSTVTLTNATGLPVAGLANLGAGVATYLTTPNSANLGATLSDKTGSGAAVFATSPSLTTPSLGIATATTVNKVTLTAPATGSTLTIADGKTLTASNTLTLTATDGSTLAIGGGGTLGTAAYQSTGTSGATVPLLNGANTYSGNSIFSAAGAASSPGLDVTGVPFGGTATTSKAVFLVEPNTVTTSNNWGTTGNLLGVNCPATNYFALNVQQNATARFQLTCGGTATFSGTWNFSSATVNLATVWASTTAPSIQSGFGTSPSVTNNNGTAAFTVNVGTGGTATSGVITMPAAAHGWACQVNDITTTSSTVFVTKETANTTTSVTVGNFTTAGVAGAWAASDILYFICSGF